MTGRHAGALCLSLMVPLAACAGDETAAAYGAGDTLWALSELDGRAFAANATLEFTGQGMIRGTAPCNQYSAEMTTPYPWFEAGSILSTKRACPDLQAENAYFIALGLMTQIEVLGDTLLLSNEDGRQMLFKAAD